MGKTTAARILAKCLQCEQGPTETPCCECSACKEISAGNCIDVFEIDGASNRGINEIRELREGVAYAPQRDRYKIYIIDEVHMLTTEAFNALLKTLEEPPSHVKFIFATTEPQRIPVTILSRCQRFDFKRIPSGVMTQRLLEILDEESLMHFAAPLEVADTTAPATGTGGKGAANVDVGMKVSIKAYAVKLEEAANVRKGDSALLADNARKGKTIAEFEIECYKLWLRDIFCTT